MTAAPRTEGGERLARVTAMERLYEQALCALRAQDPAALCAAQEAIRTLEAYYTGGQWLADYEADEAGELPPQMKRGVLAQDALYDLLEEHARTRKR